MLAVCPYLNANLARAFKAAASNFRKLKPQWGKVEEVTMFNNRKSMFLVAILVIMGLAFPIVVSAQASTTPVVLYTYDGAPMMGMMIRGANPIFQPGDTSGAAVVLQSSIPFEVVSYADASARDAGIQLGGASAVCSQTLVGQNCSLDIIGTDGNMWLEVIFTPGSYVEFVYGNTIIGRFNGANPVFQPGNTTATSKMLVSNMPFVAVNYETRLDLDNRVPMGSVPATCNTLVGQNCTMTIGGTTAAMWIEVMPASAVPAVTLTPTTTPVAQGAVITPTATPNPLLGQGGGAVATTGLPTATSSVTQSGWTVQYFTGATADMLAYQFPVLNPLVWGSFPNVDNSAAGFLAANGLEYGEDESQTCGAADDACDLVVAARSYVIITGDYALDGIGSCTAANGRGCAIMITNVGDVSASLTGTLDNVFIIQGRYWNGDRNFLPGAIVAGLSHASHNMLNLNSALNPTGASNAGANCSVPGGCISVDVRGVVTSGNQPLVAISTIANR